MTTTGSESSAEPLRPGIVLDEDLSHDTGCEVGDEPRTCTCGAYAEQQMMRLRYVVGGSGLFA